MRKIIGIMSLAFLLMGVSLNVKSQEMTEEQKISYALGANVGENFKSAGIEVNFETFKEGFLNAMAGANKLSKEEMQAAFEAINAMVEKKQNAGANEEKEKGKAFLASNKTKEGVVETASGLQYKVITMGTGAKPNATDKVKVHYHGTTLEGKVFDSSVQRGQPIEFGLNQVIAGWTEGVQLMPIGSKFIFYIPSDLAYGDRGAGADIKPGMTLIFEVELLDINAQ